MITLSPPSVILLRFAKLVAAGLLPLVLAVAMGAYVTHQVAGGAGIKAMLVGCAVAMLGNWMGALPVAMVSGRAARDGGLAALMGTALRFLAALVLTPALALTGWVDVAPFVIWVAISYLAILIGETIMLVRMVQAEQGTRG
ncbi:MAG: hypothetical protein JSU68_08985 [Phycisphaerales bacterium]|nr:MAG: hypothetical protein JSU68_08985 [Phycisphaerales bacterium]